jgi:hypothetical protein
MSTSPTPPLPTRQVWLVVWGALAAAPIAYAVIAQQVQVTTPPPGNLPLLRMAFLAVAALGFVAGSLLMSRAGTPGGFPPAPPASPDTPDLVAPATFQLRSIIAMALFESVAIYGFVLVMLGGPPLLVLPWSATSLVGLVGIALPNGLAYWRRWEMDAARTGPSAIG